MASVTFAIEDDLLGTVKKFSWVNWSEVARTEVTRRANLEEARRKLETKEEQEFIKWSVELGRKAKKGRLNRILSKLSPEERKRLGV